MQKRIKPVMKSSVKTRLTPMPNLKGVFKTHENNTLFTGLDYVFEGLEPTETSKMLNNEYQSVYTLAAYVQDEVKLLDAISVVAGIRYAYNEKFKSQFTPKLSLMYQYSGLNVRASYAAGFRSPTLQQMYAVSESRGQITVGDPDLDPEKSNFYNLNIEYNHRLFSIAASIYQNDLKDKIEVEDIGTTPEDIENGITRRRQYRNIEKARVKGFDIGFSVRPFTGFMFGANYIYTDGRNRTEDIRLERTVRHSGNFNASWRKHGTIIHSILQSTDAIKVHAGLKLTATPPPTSFGISTHAIHSI